MTFLYISFIVDSVYCRMRECTKIVSIGHVTGIRSSFLLEDDCTCRLDRSYCREGVNCCSTMKQSRSFKSDRMGAVGRGSIALVSYKYPSLS